MQVEDLLGKDLIKQLDITTSLHAKFTEENKRLKSLFKMRISMKELEKISEVINLYGYPDDKVIILDFIKKFSTGHCDDNDIVEFKKVIEPYMEQIEVALESMAKKE